MIPPGPPRLAGQSGVLFQGWRIPVCEGKPCISARGPPACLQAAGPPGISSRNSLPALNAMPGVQALPPVQCVRSRRAFVSLRRSQGHPPGPPQLAGRKGKGRQRPSFDSLLFWGVPGAQANAPPHAVRRKGRRARRCRILWPPGAERPGTPRAGGYLSVSVSCRTRSRRPTPSRPAPGRRVKGKISRQGGRCTSVSALFGARLRKKHGSNAGTGSVCGK